MAKKIGLGTICTTLLDKLNKVKRGTRLVIVETGTMKDAEHEPGWETEERSTLAIAKWINSLVGPVPKIMPEFYSIDSSPGSIAVSAKAICDAGVADFVSYREGDSRAELEKLNTQIDFALLDSDTDPQKILREFEWVHKVCRWPCIIVIDDVYDRGDVNKGALAVPQAQRYFFKTVRIGNTEAIAMGPDAERIIAEVAQELAQ